jgi:hypothetical protein
MTTVKRPLSPWPIGATNNQAKLKRQEQRELCVMLERQRQEQSDLSESHCEMRKLLEASIIKDCREIQLRHQREWFIHRRKHGHFIGAAGIDAITKGNA